MMLYVIEMEGSPYPAEAHGNLWAADCSDECAHQWCWD